MSPKKRIRKILVANRGEIAVRVMRTCREMGLATVAVYSDADRGALHVRKADEAVHLGPAPARDSYLAIEKVIDAAKKTGADAIHPGYGFLSERAELARAADAAGITFIGPPAASMDAMGVKTTARRNMNAAGVPTVPGSEGPIADEQEAKAFADAIGYPVMIKAAAGGGGKGMKKVEREADFPSLWASARRESAGAFGDDRLYLEKFLDEPRHVEVQVFADEHGNAIHLGERECSVQRRQQKVVEESPSCILDERMRARMGDVAVRAAKAVGYRGAGTVEFLVDARRDFYFLEMNTRLQVEHPVTEMLTGLDLVRMQIEVARGERLVAQEEVVRRGHAIEARIYAEDPARRFMPSPGKITYLRVPGGPGIRDDSGVYTGWVVPQFYDPLISKLVAWAPTREQAIERLIRALGEYTVHGISTNIAYLAAVLDHPAFRSGEYDTGFCARYERDLLHGPDPAFEDVALIAAAVEAFKRDNDAAEEFAARAGAAGARSAWARLGRARGLRGGGR
jgi:acetyl-CoA carboxylase biotin carboxylase subunit